MGFLGNALSSAKKKVQKVASNIATNIGKSTSTKLTPYAQSRVQDYAKAGVNVSKPITQSVAPSVKSQQLNTSTGGLGTATKTTSSSKSSSSSKKSSDKSSSKAPTQSLLSDNNKAKQQANAPTLFSMLGGKTAYAQTPGQEIGGSQTPGISPVNFLRAGAGNAVDVLSTLGGFGFLPEMNLSENIAGEKTAFTGRTEKDPMQGALGGMLMGTPDLTSNTLGTTDFRPELMQTMATPEDLARMNSTGVPTGGGYTGGMTDTAGLGQLASDAIGAGNQAETDTINTAFDENKDILEDQADELDALIKREMQSNVLAEKDLDQSVAGQKTDAANQTEEQKAIARETAQETERRNRNTLRALGILGSSAAGDILTKPWNEYDKAAASLGVKLVNWYKQLDDYKNTESAKIAQRAQTLRDTYLAKVTDIKRDLRFNERDRADAITAANAAMKQELANLKMALLNTSNTTGAQQAQVTEYLEALKKRFNNQG